ncbi:MAG: hypothetical protein ACI4OU_03820 [Candidatus Enterenecus sp.]
MKQFNEYGCLPCGKPRRPPRSMRVPDWQRVFLAPESPMWQEPASKY